MEVIENILKYEKKNLKIDEWVIFHPYANFNCPYLKIGLCDMFPVLLECITNEVNCKTLRFFFFQSRVSFEILKDNVEKKKHKIFNFLKT